MIAVVYDNKEKLDLTSENKRKANELITKINDNLSFFKETLDGATRNSVHTHLGLFESYFKELSDLLEYDSVIAEEMELRYSEIRKANRDIRRLEEKLGSGITVEGVTSKLKEYENILRCLYGTLGFEYVNICNMYVWGFIAEFNHDIVEQHDGYAGNKEWVDYFTKCIPHLTDPKYKLDLLKEKYHNELLDTDNNRDNILSIMREYLPDFYINEFTSRHNDSGSFSLKFKARITFKDLDELLKRIVG